eukprot:1157458-Pelagomonas_calceolata.AAC.2
MAVQGGTSCTPSVAVRPTRVCLLQATSSYNLQGGCKLTHGDLTRGYYKKAFSPVTLLRQLATSRTQGALCARPLIGKISRLSRQEASWHLHLVAIANTSNCPAIASWHNHLRTVLMRDIAFVDAVRLGKLVPDPSTPDSSFPHPKFSS